MIQVQTFSLDTLQTTLGTLVVESPADSGSLITAREAGDQGRDVFAIPGPIDTGRNAGCHALIQDGAKLVQSVDDILSELGVLALRAPDAEPGTLPLAPVPNLPPNSGAFWTCSRFSLARWTVSSAKAA